MSDSNTYLDLADHIADSFPEIESDITVDLRKTDEEYCSLFDSISELKAKHPFILDIMEGDGELSLSAEEHEILTRFFKLQFRPESMEPQHIYFRGHTDCISYLKKVGAL
jgi:hypothetical protein